MTFLILRLLNTPHSTGDLTTSLCSEIPHFLMDAEPFTGEMLQSSSSTMVEKELDESESTVDTERSAVEIPQPDSDSVIEKMGAVV